MVAAPLRRMRRHVEAAGHQGRTVLDGECRAAFRMVWCIHSFAGT